MSPAPPAVLINANIKGPGSRGRAALVERRFPSPRVGYERERERGIGFAVWLAGSLWANWVFKS